MIAAFDLDGTLLKKNSSFAFCRYLCEKGLFSKWDLFFCIQAYLRHNYGELALFDLHTLIFERLFKGQKISFLQPYLESFLETKVDSFWYPPAIRRLNQLQKQGVRCLVFSNSPRFIVAPIVKKLGIHEVFATEYLSDDQGVLSVVSTFVDGEQKKSLLVSLEDAPKIAFSDSELDLPFLMAADIAVAVKPKRKLKKIALKKKWEIL